jgi:hypothetical protein
VHTPKRLMPVTDGTEGAEASTGRGSVGSVGRGSVYRTALKATATLCGHTIGLDAILYVYETVPCV